MFNKLRYFLIELLSGDMPVVLNMNITRPEGFKGRTAYFSNDGPGLFAKNLLWGEARKSMLTPRREVNVKTEGL